MRNWDVYLAKMLKNRDNKEYIGAVVGNVLSTDPIKIGILDNKIILDSSLIYLCSSLKENFIRNATMEIDNYTVDINATDSRGDTIEIINVNKKDNYNTKITFKDILKEDDKVLVIAAEDNQNFFIVDKLL